ncbi:MAG: recombinase family protein [Acidobacteriota bacterium]
MYYKPIEPSRAEIAIKDRIDELYTAHPFGFVRIGGQLIEDLKELEIIDQIKSWRGDGWSLRRIAAELCKLGVPTKEGGQWFASTVRYLLQNDL